MHWISKVTFLFICCFINSNCRSLSPYFDQSHSKQKEFNPARSNNSIREISKDAQNLLFGDLRRYYLRSSGIGEGVSLANNLATPKNFYNKNEMKRRGLDVGILVKIPTTKKYDSDLEKLEAMLVNDIENRLGKEKYNNISECPSCEEEEEVQIEHSLKPAFKCDEWDPKHRACILERNIGDTVTFYLSTGKAKETHRPVIIWKKEFHMRDSEARKKFIIDPQNPPENIIVGKRGFEFRISPITETDVAYNIFSVSLQQPTSIKLHFMIRIVPVDLGFVYVGETIELNLRNFISLPEQLMSFKWYMERDGESGTLPSNMKVSITGSSIKISELRQEQEGILACSVYTNLHILATKKRFLIKDLSKNKDVLQYSPNHTLIFKEEESRLKRDPKKLIQYISSSRLSRQKRALLSAADDESALFQSSATEKEIPRYNDYNPYLAMQNDKPQTFEDYDNNLKRSIGNDKNFVNFPENKQVDRFVNQEPVAVEKLVGGQRNLEYPPATEEESPFQVGLPMDVMNSPDTRPVMNQPVNLQMNAPGPFLSEPENELMKNPQQYLLNEKPLENTPNEIQNGRDLKMSVNRVLPFNGRQKQNILQPVNLKNDQNEAKYIDLYVQTEGHHLNQQDNYSDIVLNIGRAKPPRKVTAEMQIAKLISYCFSDFECSITATCVGASLKKRGFCRCLPGTNGVGIFCREEIWLSNSNFDIEEQTNSDYMTYIDTSPTE